MRQHTFKFLVAATTLLMATALATSIAFADGKPQYQNGFATTFGGPRAC